MRGKEPECQPCSTCGTHRGSSQAPTPAHSHQPSAASSPPDVVDGGAEVMGPVGKSAVQAVFGAVAFRVCLVDADSSLVVAQVVPALSVPCGPVQERAPETWQLGSLTFAPWQVGYQPSTETRGCNHSGSRGQAVRSSAVAAETRGHCQSGTVAGRGPRRAWHPGTPTASPLKGHSARGLGSPGETLQKGDSWGS